ncbi:hypothetical protein ACEWY4_000286 [Coilia grayii]|uniref:Rab-GAP TBC domain-containing protein n=1 Tax=Coilia grayii TaxID=363190 RepID=A0ABD1KW75_9TELE
MATDSRIHFWKRNTKGPGRFLKDTPKSNSTQNVKSKKASSFLEFARSTNDAWDIDDEEDEDLFMAAAPPVPPSHPRPAAVTVPLPPSNPDSDSESHPSESHPTDTLGSLGSETCHDEQRTEGRSTNGRVVKSNSDAQLNTSSVRSSLQKQQSLPVRPIQKQQSLPVRPIIPLVARISDQNASGAPPMTVREKSRLDKFRQLLASPNTDLEELRKHSWSGIPREVRPITWRLLSGYLPANMERREQVLQRKREEYFGFIEQYYHSRTDEHHRDTYRQIHIDIPRTNPLIPLFQQPLVQEVFERILFTWAIRHPASGYVQGINDLVTPFFVVFLSEFVEEDVENFEMSALPLDTQRNIEADSFWCMSKLLDGIQRLLQDPPGSPDQASGPRLPAGIPGRAYTTPLPPSAVIVQSGDTPLNLRLQSGWHSHQPQPHFTTTPPHLFPVSS